MSTKNYGPDSKNRVYVPPSTKKRFKLVYDKERKKYVRVDENKYDVNILKPSTRK